MPETLEILPLPRGTQLLYRHWPVPGARGYVIFLHGWGDHAGRYAEAAARLAQAGYACAALDFEGHGRSPGARARVHDFERLVQDTRALMVRLSPRRPVYLHGHSMGGCVAGQLALRYPQEVAGLLLNSAALDIHPRVSRLRRRLAPLLAQLRPSLPVGRLKTAALMSSLDGEQARYRADRLIHHGPIDAGTAAALMQANRWLGRRFGQLRCPLLVLQGGADELVDPAGAERLYREARAASKELVVFAQARHDLLHEPVKTAVIEALQRWLDARHGAADPRH